MLQQAAVASTSTSTSTSTFAVTSTAASDSVAGASSGLRAGPAFAVAPASAAPAVRKPIFTPAPLSPSTPTSLVNRPRRPLFGHRTVAKMNPYIREFAEQMGIMPMLQELADKQNPPGAFKAMALQNYIDDVILQTYFDAAAFMGEAEREQTRLESFRSRLVAARDKKVEINNAANFISSGTLNTVGSAISMPSRVDNVTSNINQLISGVVSTGLSSYALKQNHGGKTVGWSKPTVLAELFGRPTDMMTAYPESVWRFFHCSMPECSGMTRVQWLEQFWLDRKHIEPAGSRRLQRKLDIVSGVPSTLKDVTISDISDQIDMIADVEIVTSQMIQQLRNLLTISHFEPVSLRNQRDLLIPKGNGEESHEDTDAAGGEMRQFTREKRQME